MRALVLMTVLALVAPCTVLVALANGSVDVSGSQLWQVFTGAGEELHRNLVLQLRLPRALSGFAVGGMLALSGALLQVLLRNPLADPYVLGISGGAGVAALGAMLLGLGSAAITGSAAAGALLSMWLVFGLSRAGGPWTQTRLLLTGIIVAAGWGALVSLILALTPESNVHGMLYWLMGDLSHDHRPIFGIVMLALGVTLTIPLARSFNVLARGELTATSLGENVELLRIAIYFLASTLAAAAVVIAGGIGFIGLVVPHLARLLGGSDYRTLLPNAVLLGGSLLVLADTLARTVLAPRQLPVGVITALAGVLVFLILLRRGYNR